MPHQSQESKYLQDIAPQLFNPEFREKSRVPEGYFDKFEDRVLDRIHAENPLRKEPQRKRFTINMKNLALAAGLAVLLAIVPYLRETEDSEKTKSSSEQIVVIDVSGNRNAIISKSTNFSNDMIYSEISEADLRQISLPPEISNEEIAEYIAAEGISDDVLYDEIEMFVNP